MNTPLMRLSLLALFLLASVVGCDNYESNFNHSDNPSGANQSKEVQQFTDEEPPEYKSATLREKLKISRSNMKQLGLAIYNYNQAHQKFKFPPAYTANRDGKPLLSWRVLILPFVGEAALFREFHLNEPWDSEHNKKLIEKIPDVFKSPMSKVADQGKTNYLTVRGERTVFPGEKSTDFSQIKDGSSYTVMMVEAADDIAVIWTKPDDFEYDENDPAKGLIGLWPSGFLTVFADGSVQRLEKRIDSEILRRLFMRDDGKKLDINDF